MGEPELEELRAQIDAVDRELLGALNRRVELVGRVREHKQRVGARLVDAGREAAQLSELTAGNRGPLSDRAVRAIFSAVLDVMKLEPAAARAEAKPTQRPPLQVGRIAIVGTGLVGTSVALAAARSGVTGVRAWDVDPATLDDAAARGGLTKAASLAEAVQEADLVIVAVPVGSAVATVREALAAAGADATVTDVASTKRALAAAVDDPRFVPGHPVAGGETGGPGRASADLFDGATWFLTPTAATDPDRVTLVERLVTALGARPVRQDAETHDRLLALTSHLPHALANSLLRTVAHEEAALVSGGASLREMTRVAGANPSVWSDIFVENGDLIADALGRLRADLEAVEAALRDGKRDFFDGAITEAADARSRMLAHAYGTEATQLHRIRIRVPDRPGVLAHITQILGAAGINIEDFELRHVSREYGGVLVIFVTGGDTADLARTLLRHEGYAAA